MGVTMFRRLRAIKISTRIALSFALVLPITVWALVVQSSDSWRIYRTAKIADVQNASANALIMGVYEILIERQFVNNALRAAEPAAQDALKDIQAYRSEAKRKIDQAFAELQTQDFSGKTALVAGFDAAREKMNAYRGKADAAVALAAPTNEVSDTSDRVAGPSRQSERAAAAVQKRAAAA
jgi:hypothetical protein